MGVQRRNYLLFFLDTVVFTPAMAFLSVNAFISYYLTDLGASTFEVALPAALGNLCCFVCQPLFVRMSLKRPMKARFFAGVLAAQRVMLAAFILSMPLFSASPVLMRVLFLVSWGLFSCFIGGYSPFFYGLLPKLVRKEHQGRLVGIGGVVGNLMALGASALGGYLIAQLAFPYNYMAVFGAGCALLLVDAGLFLLIREHPQASDAQVNGYLDYLRQIPKVIGHSPAIRHIVSGNVLSLLATLPLSFYTLYAVRAFQAQAAQVALLSGLAVAAALVANLAAGFVADHAGHHRVMQLNTGCSLLAGLLILLLPSLPSLYVAWTLTNFSLASHNLSSIMQVSQHAPAGQEPLFVSVNNMAMLIVSFLGAMTCSQLIDILGFQALFIFATLAAAGALCIFLCLGRIYRQTEEA